MISKHIQKKKKKSVKDVQSRKGKKMEAKTRLEFPRQIREVGRRGEQGYLAESKRSKIRPFPIFPARHARIAPGHANAVQQHNR